MQLVEIFIVACISMALQACLEVETRLANVEVSEYLFQPRESLLVFELRGIYDLLYVSIMRNRYE